MLRFTPLFGVYTEFGIEPRGYGKTVLDIAEQLGYNPIIVLDDVAPSYPLSSFKDYLNLPNVEYIVAFGSNALRLQWFSKLEESGAKLATLIHPTAYISPHSIIHPGTVIIPHAVVNTGCAVETGCIIKLAAIIDHDCIIKVKTEYQGVVRQR